MHNAKMETERKMRNDLDRKILAMRIERLTQSFGKEFAERLRYYIKMYNALKDTICQNLDQFNRNVTDKSSNLDLS